MIKPYGSDKLVDRYLKPEEEHVLEDLDKASTRRIPCDPDTILECERIADGSLTPIEGFCSREEVDSILHEQRLLSGVYYPLPILCQVDEKFGGLGNQPVLLTTSAGELQGYIESASFYQYDLELLCRFMFGTADRKHPGVNRLMSGGNTFVSGRMRFKKSTNDLSRFCASPADVRREIENRKWQTCIGFQTRNVPHLAHEHLQRIALEFHDGLLLQPVIGWKKADDYRPEVVMGAYTYMLENMYPPARVLLKGLQIQMRYAGPKEAVIHAIIRQNYGCTHFIVGRDHAGVGGYYDKYAAHKIFDNVAQHLDIHIRRLKGPYFCSRCRGIVTENTCGHAPDAHEEVSGSIIREMLLDAKYPPERFIRKEIVDVIRTYDEIFIAGAARP